MINYCESGNEPSGNTNGWKFPDQLSDCHLLNQSFATYLGQVSLCLCCIPLPATTHLVACWYPFLDVKSLVLNGGQFNRSVCGRTAGYFTQYNERCTCKYGTSTVTCSSTK
jgi:hypothetical protein